MTMLKIDRILLYFINRNYANEWVPLCSLEWMYQYMNLVRINKPEVHEINGGEYFVRIGSHTHTCKHNVNLQLPNAIHGMLF